MKKAKHASFLYEVCYYLYGEDGGMDDSLSDSHPV